MKNIQLKLKHLKRIGQVKKLRNLLVLGLSFVFIIFSVSIAQGNKKETKIIFKSNKNFSKMYKEALHYYNVGSYYTAINLLYKIIRYPENKYYKKSLYLLAKIYIHIGRKTGIKKYFYIALSLLNLYAGTEKRLKWDYYYTKANLFEVWGFYERAMNFYKFALYNAKNKKQEIKTLIGVLRTAVWTKKLDTVSAFAIRLSISQLLKSNSQEVQFLNGLILFSQGRYKEATNYLIKTYKYYETYLIDNPLFYYIVAENMYRVGKYKFAKHLFRRIISTTQDVEIIRKSILRLGDIDVKENDLISAFNHYYYLAQDYKNSNEATIAKLKILSLKEKEPIKEKLAKTEDEDLKEPIKFIYRTLISNRNTPLGRYAIGNFGQIVLKYNSNFLVEKLSWELSVLQTDRFSYEEKEYVRNLWKDKIRNIKPEYMCKLYSSNPRFFKEIFKEETLIEISHLLGSCNIDFQIDLYKFLVEKHKKDKYKIKLAQSLINKKQFKKAITVLKTVRNKNCKYFTTLTKVYILLDKKNIPVDIRKLENCRALESKLIFAFLNIDKDFENILNLANENVEFLTENYNKDLFVNKLVNILITKAFEKEKYNKVLNLLKKLAEKYKEDCNINSWYTISMIRTNTLKDGNLDILKNCSNTWSKIAKELFEDYKLIKEVKK